MKTEYDIDLLREYEAKGLVTAREHPSLPLVVWNYTAETQYSRAWDNVTKATRGLVTDLQGNAMAMCIPKFFNLAETDYEISEFDIAHEKLDGSLIHIFWYDGRWICSSRGSFESDQARWAEELLDKGGNRDFLSDCFDYRTTFVCELIHPDNRIVLDYGNEYSLRLITMFEHDMWTPGWKERFPSDDQVWPWEVAKTIPMEALPTYLDQPGVEGAVLINRYGRRVKIKTQEYVELHRVVTNLTTKRVLEHYIEHGDVEELLEVVPDEWYERIGQLAWSFQDRVQFYEAAVRQQFYNVQQSMGKDATRKDFAMAVKGQRNAPYLFSLLDGKDITDMIAREVLRDYEKNGLEL